MLRLVPACAAVALLATALFFLLHYAGNQLPYDLAVERFKAELASDLRDEGNAAGWKEMHEYRELSGTVLAGARKAGEDSTLRDAVVLKSLYPLEEVVSGAAIPEYQLRPRYWWGSKALYAVALRYVSVYQLRELTRIATRVAYLLLGVSLLLLSPKMLLLASPLLVFGAFFSGVEYWADVANGLPYLWTVLFVAGLALLMRLTRGAAASGAAGGGGDGAAWPGTVPLYCFAAGTVSSYLALMDGHLLFAVTWIGMVVWFGHDALNVAERSRRALSCIVLYGAGIVVCHALGQMVKAMFLGEEVWLVFWDGIAHLVADSTGGVSKHSWAAHGGRPIWASNPLLYLDFFYAAYWPSSLPSGAVPPFVATFSLAASLCLAVFEKRRGRSGLLWGVLWIVALMSTCCLTFQIIEDVPYRTARYVFVPLALCLSCLFLALPALWPPRTPHWRMSLAAACALSAILIGLLVVAWAVSWYLTTFKSRAVGEMIESVEGMRPIASSFFDVYLDEDRLVYVKEECSKEDVDAVFFLHVYPADVADLKGRRRQQGFDDLNFPFERAGLRSGERCAAVRRLRPSVDTPTASAYEAVAIRTGQDMPGKGRGWNERVVLPGAVDKVIEIVEGMQPTVSSSFDVYRIFPSGTNRLIYVKKECSDGDVDVPFFLHVHPTDVADLPPHRRPHGFDSYDFSFETFGFRGGGRCAAVRLLPDYDVAAIQTGQQLPGKDPEWSERIGAAFDVHLDGDRLVYVNEECTDSDIDARFFLHVTPADVADLPPDGQPYGFDNLDFSFEEVGLRNGGRCTVERLLPDYDVVAIRTGQFVREGRVWERRFDLTSAK